MELLSPGPPVDMAYLAFALPAPETAANNYHPAKSVELSMVAESYNGIFRPKPAMLALSACVLAHSPKMVDVLL